MSLRIAQQPITEAEFQRQVIALAHICGWRVAHFRAARTSSGWRTAVEADGAGWPDLVLVHPRRRKVLYRELKSERGDLSAAQYEWLAALESAGQDAGVWRPGHWPLIEQTLTGE